MQIEANGKGHGKGAQLKLAATESKAETTCVCRGYWRAGKISQAVWLPAVAPVVS
jgi:hypothetical protein